MSRRARIALIVAGSLIGLVLVLAVAAVFILQSGWFREQVRRRMAAEIETATGGTVEVGAFHMDWKRLVAQVDGFVLHGTEPRGSKPLVVAPSITVGLKVLSVLKKQVDLDSLVLKDPEVRLIMHADGSTNIPEPKIKRVSQKSVLEGILDLAIKHFRIENGVVEINSERKPPFHLTGENLRAKLDYQVIGPPRYQGQISIRPLQLKWGQYERFPVAVEIKLAIEKSKIDVAAGKLGLAKSQLEFSGNVTNLPYPEGHFRYDLRADLAEIGSILGLRSRQEGRIQVAGGGNFSGGANYAVAGGFHATGVMYQSGAFRLRNFSADATLNANADKIHLTGLRLSGLLRPDVRRGEVQVGGTVEDASLAPATQDLELHKIRLAALGGSFAGDAELRKFERFRLQGTLSGFDVQRLVGAYSAQKLPWDARLSGPVRVETSLGRKGPVTASARLTLSPARTGAPVQGLIDLAYDSRRDILDLRRSYLALPSTRVDFSGAIGTQLQVRLESRNLDDLLPALGASVPIRLENGQAAFNGTVSGKLDAPRIAGHVSLTNFAYSGRKVEAFNADISASPSGAQVQNGSLARGRLRADFQGSVGLAKWKTSDSSPLSASASIRNADMADLMAMLDQKDVPVTGALNASAQAAGTIGNPQVAADVSLVKGQIGEEPFDRLEAKLSYTTSQVQAGQARLVAGKKQIDLNATYRHAPGDFRTGQLQFQVASNQMPVDQFRTIVKDRPGVQGTVQVTARGGLSLGKAAAGKPPFHIGELQAEITGKGLRMGAQPLGDAHLTASTSGGLLHAKLESDFANSVIRGDGQWRLADDYPGTATISFSKVDLGNIRDWLAPRKSASQREIAGSMQGKITIDGPAINPEAWRAALTIPSLEVGPAQPGPGATRASFRLKNAGPIVVTMQKSVVRVESAHLVGRATDISLTGTVSVRQKNPMDLRLNGKLDLTMLSDFDRDIIASGAVVTNAEIRGTTQQPQIGGRLEMKGANFNVVNVSNGVSNANGVIVFSGTQARIQSFTAESGGGKVTLTGFAGYGGEEVMFRMQANASQVRYRSDGVSAVADAALTLTGTTTRSVLAGSVTITRLGFNPHSDASSMLAKSAEPVRTPSARTGLLAGMHFDVQVETAPDIRFQSSLAQDIQAEASLRLRGTATNPALLGRVTISQGEIVFFGTKYTIEQGSIAFYNPVRIEPVLNIDLETKARGIDVILTVSGPLNKLTLTPRSDPPLAFSEIVALLATGRAPTSNPARMSQQATAPQSWQQMGASALLGQALANPVAGRLQRFFGVTKLKIDPTISGVENNPQARLTLEQQVTRDLTFTYITNVTSSNPQVVRVEWSFARIWSIVAVREENGLFGLDFLYKRRFR